MDRSIIELARERARIADAVPGTPGIPGTSGRPTSPPSRCLQRWLAIGGESNLYWACCLLFATGVLLALLGDPVVPAAGIEGGACHGPL